MWLDDDLLYDEKRAMKLFNEMVKANLRMTWDASNGLIAASCSFDCMKAAADSGCIGVRIGMESGNPKILRDIVKPGTVKNFLKAAENLKRIPEINSQVFVMLGFPGETFRMILDTIDVCIQMDLDWYGINVLAPLPNTPIYDSMLDEGLIDSADFESMSYTAGNYGKLKNNPRRIDLLSRNFKSAFDVNLDTVPNKEELDHIWAYMNFHINFVRLFDESRSIKISQQYKWLRYVCDQVSPENVIAKYFFAYLHFKMNGEVLNSVINEIEEILKTDEYWNQRFIDFNLTIDQLRESNFDNNTFVQQERSRLKSEGKSYDDLLRAHVRSNIRG